MADDMGLLAAGVAVVVALVALVGRGAGETVLRPVGGDGSDPSGGGTPDDLQEPADDDWQYEEPSDNPANDDTDLDFGNDPYADGSDDGGGTGSIPDSLADFDPSGRVDLVNQDEDDGGTWVGL